MKRIISRSQNILGWEGPTGVTCEWPIWGLTFSAPCSAQLSYTQGHHPRCSGGWQLPASLPSNVHSPLRSLRNWQPGGPRSGAVTQGWSVAVPCLLCPQAQRLIARNRYPPLKMPEKMSVLFHAFLHSCLDTDPSVRWTARELLEVKGPWLQGHSPHQLPSAPVSTLSWCFSKWNPGRSWIGRDL